MSLTLDQSEQFFSPQIRHQRSAQMASDKMAFGIYSRVLLLPFFSHQLSGNASSELLVLASVSQFSFLPPLNCQWKNLPRSYVTHLEF